MEPDYTELIDRLRRNAEFQSRNHMGNGGLMEQAANSIEQLSLRVKQSTKMTDFELHTITAARRHIGFATNEGMAEAGRLLDAVIVHYDRANDGLLED